MKRALYLARLGEGRVRPNPLVGCVIVRQGKVIGEGYHQEFGGPHAEVNAIASVENHDLLRESEVFVTLEPCSHYGKTPPCADLLIEKGVPKVYLCNLDPNPLVAGKGVEKLEEAGIQVITGVLQEEGRAVNRRFFTQMEKQRPYLLLKWAQTADGFIARKNYDSKWISNSLSRKLVHQYRTQEAGIFVGTNTALYDNPRLTSRDWKGRAPLRLVLDLNDRLPENLRLFDGEAPTVCYTYGEERQVRHCEWKSLQRGQPLETQLIEDWNERQLQSVLIEGGRQLLQLFIDRNLWDEAKVFISPTNFDEGVSAPQLSGRIPKREEKVRRDLLLTYENH